EKLGVSAVILAARKSEKEPEYRGIEKVLQVDNTDIRIFGKPSTRPFRRMGVVLKNTNLQGDINALRHEAKDLASQISIQ
ncbi:MAG: phosphoribosylglycinamide formyltransferase 2, partial [Luteibaculum sp.]